MWKSVTSMSLLGLLGPGGSVTEGVSAMRIVISLLFQKGAGSDPRERNQYDFSGSDELFKSCLYDRISDHGGAADSSGIKEEGSLGARRRAS